MIPLLIVLVLLAYATICDLKTREIPDWISLAITATAFVGSLSGWLGIDLLMVFAGGALAIVLGVVLFHFGRLGGGDAKLIFALGFLLGPAGLIILLIVMALAGGVLAIVAVCRRQSDFAYVPAITLGFMGYLATVVWVVS